MYVCVCVFIVHIVDIIERDRKHTHIYTHTYTCPVADKASEWLFFTEIIIIITIIRIRRKRVY